MHALSETKTRAGRVTLRMVLCARLLLGFYYPLSCNPLLRFLARLYCFCLAAFSTIVIISSLPKSIGHLILYCFLIFEYDLSVFMALLTEERYVFKFYKSIERADSELGFDHLPLITSVAQYLFFLMGTVNVLSNFWLVLQYMLTAPVIVCSPFMLTITATGVYFNNWIHVLSLDLLRHRLSLLRHVLKFNLQRNNWSRTNRHNQIKTINKCLKLYKDLIDHLNVSISWAKCQMFVGLACAFVHFVSRSLAVIQSLKYDNISLVSGITGMGKIIDGSFCACLPAIFAELVARETDRLMAAIGDELICCEDDGVQRALELAADYLELRPFRVSIFRVFELNSSFVLAFISMCTTYLIVAIQITGVI